MLETETVKAPNERDLDITREIVKEELVRMKEVQPRNALLWLFLFPIQANLPKAVSRKLAIGIDWAT